MSYKILYDPTLTNKFPQKKTNTFSFARITIIMACVFAVVAYISKARVNYRTSSTMESTTAAFTEMVDDLRSGETILEAFSDLCIKIIENESETNS